MGVDNKLLKDVTGGRIVDALRDINETLGGRPSRGTVYGFHINGLESDPSAKVTYVADAAGLSPAYMDYANGVFCWGGWRDAFFMPRPCMLKFDGTVDYYLDEYDHSKREDGAASDVANPNYQGNAMMEWGRGGKIIWLKVVPDVGDPTSVTVYVADYNVDGTYKCWPFINGEGTQVAHFYTPMYFGSIVNDGTKDVLRSLSGMAGSARCKNKNAATERTMAQANNQIKRIWDTEVFADILLIQYLLVLMGKSLDTQSVFGQGLHTGGSDAVNDAFTSGQHDAKGLFWGTSSGNAATHQNAVKVFGMENFWGFMWRRFAGLTNVDGTERYKLTRGVQDGSTATDYVVSDTAADYSGYLTGGSLLSTSGSYITKQAYDSDGSYTPSQVDGTSATHYCDALWTNLGSVCYAFRGGCSVDTALVGTWYLNLAYTASGAYWAFGACPSCKPQS